MTRKWYGLLASSLVVTGVACDKGSSTELQSRLASEALAAAFATTPVGFGDLTTSYVGPTAAAFSDGALWLGGGRDASFDHGGFMGGGIADAFVGGIAFGKGGFGNRGPFGGALRCATAAAFSSASGRVECAAETRNGLTVTRSAQYTTAAGAVQQAFDTVTTNAVNIQSAVTGTVTYDRAADGDGTGGGRGPRHDGGWGHGRGPGGRLLGDTSTILTASTTVNSSSTQTVAGLAQGSTQRTINAASKGTESTTGTSSAGSFTATRTVGDTTKGLVIPVRAATDTAKSYPTAGTVTRVMNATLTYAGQAAVTKSRREVVTYDGTATAKVAITEDGTTKNCTRPLPRGRQTCQ